MNAPTKPTLLIPDYVIASIEGYGLARASIEGSYTDAATALTEVFAQLRHWGERLQSPVVDQPTPRPMPDALTLLKAARHALRSYGFGNAAPDLGAGLASDIEQYFARMAEAVPLSEAVALDLLDATPPRTPSALEVTVETARDIAEDAEMSVIHRPWKDGAHTPGRRMHGLYQRRYYFDGEIFVCRWDGRVWWSSEASKRTADPDTWINGGISSHQNLEWRGPLSAVDLDALGWRQA